MKTLIPLALAAAAASCASAMDDIAALPGDARAAAGHAYAAARRAAAAPALAPVESPAPLTGAEAVRMPGPEPEPVSARAPNSLWQPGARNFFRDQRAGRVGDILTVAIEIDDSAELRNNSQRQRAANTEVGVPNLLGLETSVGGLFGGGFDPATLISADAASSASGQGSINREEKIDLSVAAVIVDVLPNGNFVIAGRQQVRINAELRELTVSGVIRPADIDASNRVRHDQIAEARIDYGGRGQLSAVQRPRIGQRVADSVSPW